MSAEIEGLVNRAGVEWIALKLLFIKTLDRSLARNNLAFGVVFIFAKFVRFVQSINRY